MDAVVQIPYSCKDDIASFKKKIIAGLGEAKYLDFLEIVNEANAILCFHDPAADDCDVEWSHHEKGLLMLDGELRSDEIELRYDNDRLELTFKLPQKLKTLPPGIGELTALKRPRLIKT